MGFGKKKISKTKCYFMTYLQNRDSNSSWQGCYSNFVPFNIRNNVSNEPFMMVLRPKIFPKNNIE